MNQILQADAIAVYNELKQQTLKPYLHGVLHFEATPTIFNSKAGGCPYWDLSKPYPTTKNGEKMILLAQINFEYIPRFDPLPNRGMLQFFIAEDNMYGMEDHNYAVVYHDSIDYSITKEAVMVLGIKTTLSGSDLTPVSGEIGIDFAVKEEPMGPADVRCRKKLCDIAKQLGVARQLNLETPEYGNVWEFLNFLPENIQTEWESMGAGTKLMGYPFFTQEDPREDDTQYELLFQLDSQSSKNYKSEILWGDSGIGNFFIKKEDLLNRKFQNVFYTWDCY